MAAQRILVPLVRVRVSTPQLNLVYLLLSQGIYSFKDIKLLFITD